MTAIRRLPFLVAALTCAATAGAQDWYEASGVPAQRSLLSSAELRNEFASIETDIADKLPVLTGNGGRLIAVNSGGTSLEAISAATARAALDLEINTDVLAYDAGLAAIAELATTDGNIIVGNGSTWVAESGATARASLGLGSLATASSINNSNWSGTDLAVANGGTGASDAATARSNLGLAIGSDVQAYDADLATLAGLAVTDGNFIVGNGSVWTVESGATARASLGLGSLATASSINNSNWSGADLAIANGGTGASDAATARSNLGLGALATASTISNNNWSGTDLAVVNGGTGASDAATARSNLGAASLGANSFTGNQSVSGTITATGDITAFSDARLKRNIEPISDALARLAQVRGVTFTRLDDPSGRRSAGVIAQEVRAALPEVVHEDETGMLSVAYGNLNALLIEAVKELQAEVAALRSEVATLKEAH